MQFLDLHDTRIPALGFGTFELTGKTCRDAVRHAIDLGYRHIDTAEMYENEAEVGEAIAESGVGRDELFVTTKVWWKNLRPWEIGASVEASLRRLGTDWVDLLLIHWPNPEVPLVETLTAMEKLVEEGKVRHIGVSNFPPPLLEKAVEHAKILCNQVEYHPYLDQSAILEQARKHDLFVTAYSPLAQGKAVHDPVLRQIGEPYGKSPGQVALRWLLDQERVAAIPRTSTPEHCQSNFEIFDFELSAEDRQKISRLERGERLIDPSFAPDWEAKVAYSTAH